MFAIVPRLRRDRLIGGWRTKEDAGRSDGYQVSRLFAAYSFEAGGAVNTITARLDNVTDELYRNHLSFIKDFVPEMGRNVRLLYSVRC
jgi:iron complex outermembrane receptor protein